ncbi:DUF839 domain-containing protein [Caenibius tardaugens NBRC 16725]|nr:DUF839 domain-containing protein [Caenibius tardaugens NBRC 16725]TXG94778.1 MAG: DUF839 domain-containing protein [Rhodocyclaceae bacterium]
MEPHTHTLPFPTDRRAVLKGAGAAFAALLAASRGVPALAQTSALPFYGPLEKDPQALLDLPKGFTYKVISRFGDAMDDGGMVPDNADGMGCFAMADGKLALVRNHELKIAHEAGATLQTGYDRLLAGKVLPGGTTTLILDSATLKVERQFRSLAGTIRNCAGGTTPWGSWLTCEEDVTRAGDKVGQDHGWIFEVPAHATRQVEAVPLKAMGRFNHEAAAVDPATGIVYLTEDREDGLLYRFIPKVAGKLAEGGRLEALALMPGTLSDSRNWQDAAMAPGSWHAAHWIALDNVESPADDLRKRGVAAGALPFARGEGIHMGEGELYFCCTSGGAKRYGQIFRFQPGQSGDQTGDRLQLFFESRGPEEFNYGDNLTVAPNGHLIVCEDQYTDIVDNYLRGITPEGTAYPLARLRRQTELAGACFSPDGRTLFVNAFSPTMTLAITGPWRA